MHFCRNMGALFKNKMSHISQVKVRLLLRGVAHDNRSLSGSLRECVPPLRLDLKVGFVNYLLVQISVKLVSLESPYLSSFLLHMYYVSTNLVNLPEMVIFSVGLPSIRNIVDATFEGCISCSIHSIPVAPSAPHLLPILKKPAQHSGRLNWVNDRLIFTAERCGCGRRKIDVPASFEWN
jgi:hypothetical protein